MAYELWRNKRDVEFLINLDGSDYLVKPFGIVQIPDEFHRAIVNRGYALEFISTLDSDVMYMGDMMLAIDTEGKDRSIEETITTAEAFIQRPAKPKKRKSN